MSDKFLTWVLSGSKSGPAPVVVNFQATFPAVLLSGEPTPTTSGRFGPYGGRYVPEALVDALEGLEHAYNAVTSDPDFWKDLDQCCEGSDRPSLLYHATRLTEHIGGANIWFKRDDLNHAGSSCMRNALGQTLLARRLGKKRIIAESGSGQHGVAVATVCARFGFECVIYVGAKDVHRQAASLARIRLLGAEVVPVTSGSETLKDAITEAKRDLVTNLATSYYLPSSATGAHPFPTIVRDFQRGVGQEIKQQMSELKGKLPDVMVDCANGHAVGKFCNFMKVPNVRLVGVEAGGEGLDTDRHAAPLSKGTLGVFHGAKTYVLQTPTGQIKETHSIASGLSYPAAPPELAWLKDTGRAEFVAVTDEEALRAFRMCAHREGIILSLESAHAVWGAIQLARTLPKEKDVVVCLSGSEGKDVEYVAELLEGE